MKFSGGEWKDSGSYRMMDVFNIPDGPIVQALEVKPHSGIGRHHHHNQTEVFSVQGGSAVIGIGDREWDARPGDIFLCEAMNRHWAENRSDETFWMLIFKYNSIPGDIVWE